MAGYPIARDGEEFAARSNKGEWSIAWYLTTAIPEGTAYGANAFCVTAENHVVLISEDGERWGRPGGRPEGDESWEQTVRREVSEEACAVVVDARLLGFTRSACLTGPEQGLVFTTPEMADSNGSGRNSCSLLPAHWPDTRQAFR